MKYTFKSRFSADILMLNPHAENLLRAMGKSPEAQGIVTPEQIPAAIAGLQALSALPHPESEENESLADHGTGPERRAVPLLAMLREAQAHNAEIIWESQPIKH